MFCSKLLWSTLLLATFALPVVAQQGAASNDALQSPGAVTIFGCVNKTSGAVRIVDANTSCKATERKIHWNQKGPRGPQGNQGNRGPQGPQGEQGQQGPPGVAVGYSNVNIGVFPTIPAFPGVLVAQTAPVATSGAYFISATALLDIDTGDDGGAFCYDTTASSGEPIQYGGSSIAGFQQAAVTDQIQVTAGDSVQFFCYGSEGNVSEVFNGGLTATLINSAFDANAKHRHAHAASVRPPARPARQ